MALVLPLFAFITPEQSHYSQGSNMRIIDDIILPEGPQVSRDLKVC